MPSKCLSYVNGLDLVENLGRKWSSSKKEGSRKIKIWLRVSETEIVNIIFLRNAFSARKLCLKGSYIDPSYLTPESQ